MKSATWGALLAVGMCLAGCTSTPDVMTATQPGSPGQPAAATSAVGALALSSARVNFAAVVGAPESAATPLAARLAERAAERQLQVVSAEDGPSTHTMRGYFSAFTEGSETTVIYVWDVLDPAGTRLHRIQGQQRGRAGDGEGWSSVDDATMQAIADSTVDDFILWLGGNRS